MAKVSVIIPVYNAEKGIGRCLDSILKQEFTDYEVICVDDGSKDTSGRILDDYAAKDARIKVIHKKNGGVSAARNTGLQHVAGEYIQFLDADDWIPFDSTKSLVRAAEENKADLVVGDFYRVVGRKISHKGSIQDNDKEVMTLQEYAECMMESPADFYYGVLWNKLYKTSIIKEYGVVMDEDISWCEDFLFNLEYLLHVKTVALTNVPVYYYVKTEGSLVTQSMSLSKLINMKSTMFTYYNDFYKNILDEEQYRKDRPAIMGFLINGASDDSVLPILPGTHKLGSETVKAHFSTNVDNAVTLSYYLNKAYEKYLASLAGKHDLDLKEVKVIAAVVHAGEIHSLKEIADFARIGEVNLTAIVSRLMMRSLLSVHKGDEGLVINLGDQSDEIIHDLLVALDDLKDMMEKNLSEEQKQSLHEAMETMTQNLCEFIK